MEIHWNAVLRLDSHRKWNLEEFWLIPMVVGAGKCQFMPVLYLAKNAHFWRGWIRQKKRNHVMGLLWFKNLSTKKTSMILFFQGAFRFLIKKLLWSDPKRVKKKAYSPKKSAFCNIDIDIGYNIDIDIGYNLDIDIGHNIDYNIDHNIDIDIDYNMERIIGTRSPG